jgi:hypothetical protein
MPEKRSRPVPGGRGFWWSERLWAAAEGLPVHKVALTDIAELDEDCWFGGQTPTCREVAEHSLLITNADLRFPVILASDGRLMDGGRRVARAWLDGLVEVDAVRFEVDPEPDWVVPFTH